jgi:hypothetical protein
MLKAGETCERPFLPWVHGDFSPQKEAPKEVLVPITVVQTGDHETTYEFAVPPHITVGELKCRVEAECQGLVKKDWLAFHAAEGEAALGEEHAFSFTKGDLVIMAVHAKAVSAAEKEAVVQQVRKKKGDCCIQ